MLSSKSFYVIGTLALLFVSSVFADDVFVLTESNFDKEVGQDRGALVEFYAPWCEHCKKLAPEYEKLGASFKKAKSVLIGKVDCDEHKSLCSKYGVSGYPTIQWFPKGFLEPKKYEGACGAEALAEFVNKERRANVKIAIVPSNVVVLTPDNFEEIVLNNEKDVLVEFYAPCKKLSENITSQLELKIRIREVNEAFLLLEISHDMDHKTRNSTPLIREWCGLLAFGFWPTVAEYIENYNGGAFVFDDNGAAFTILSTIHAPEFHET